jgi:hypothetical protein
MRFLPVVEYDIRLDATIQDFHAAHGHQKIRKNVNTPVIGSNQPIERDFSWIV